MRDIAWFGAKERMTSCSFYKYKKYLQPFINTCQLIHLFCRFPQCR